MTKRTKKPLSLRTETIRELRDNQLTAAAGGYTSIPCATNGCSLASCAVSCGVTECHCVTFDKGCPA